jgi:uncharacterized protein (DUF2235 family)
MKRIAIFCDGTWNRVSAEYPTNVLLAAQSVLSHGADGIEQATYYDEGVGTSSQNNGLVAGITGRGLFGKIAAAYQYLVFNYVPGDEIFIFGFSRGAFTARSLAGLIRKCGIVSKSKTRDIPDIFKFYKDSNTLPDSDAAQQFRMKHAPSTVIKELDRDWRIRNGADPVIVKALPLLNIKYVGVWDTVGALGIPKYLFLSRLTGSNKKYQFHDTDLSSTIHSARHAVAVDEARRSFEPSLWSNLDTLNQASPSDGKYEQLWFPGDHGSVGGGGDIVGLSNNALIWIVYGAVAQGLAIRRPSIDEWQREVSHVVSLRNMSKPPGIWSPIYRRAARNGPQRVAELAESTIQRLEYEGKSQNVPLYRPKALAAIHKNVPRYERSAAPQDKTKAAKP